MPFASQPLQITSRITPGRITMTVRGEVDLDTAPQLGQEMSDRLSHGADPRLYLDLSGVSFMDSAGLLALLTGQRAARLLGGELVLTGTSSQVARLLSVTGAEFAVEVPARDHAPAVIGRGR
jgi:anti-sigma B factor antagonist